MRAYNLERGFERVMESEFFREIPATKLMVEQVARKVEEVCDELDRVSRRCENFPQKLLETRRPALVCDFPVNGLTKITASLISQGENEKKLVLSLNPTDYPRSGRTFGAKLSYSSLDNRLTLTATDSFASLDQWVTKRYSKEVYLGEPMDADFAFLAFAILNCIHLAPGEIFVLEEGKTV